ncbi:MAG TPA: ABC transporter permease [Candidatus Acidoferrales bacterium]|nr:ABC transporter permease [Candidatus Acidoferrales bacterium]
MSWKRIFNRKKWDEVRARELATHLEIEAEQNIYKGMHDDEARFAANRKLGNTTQIREEIFHMNSIGFMETLWQDLRFALRMLRKKPSFTIACVLTLALGIGATTAIFSVVNSVLLMPLPYRDSAKLIVLRANSSGIGDHSPSYPDFLDWRAQSQTFQEMAAITNIGFNLSGVTQPESIGGYGVSPNLLSMLGVRPVIGRDFLPSEEKTGTAPVALISYELWQSHLGSDPNVVGRSILLDGTSFTVVGVLPPSFFLPEDAKVLTPMGIWAKGDMMERGSRGDMAVIGRLAPGATVANARAEMATIAARLTKDYPLEDGNEGVSLTAIRDIYVSDSRPAILVLFGAVVFVLLIACANVANLYLVRSAERTKEIAVRLAFGASRFRILRQMLTESLLVSAIGGGLGLLWGIWGIAGFGRLVSSGAFMGMEPKIDTGVLLFAGGLVIFVAVAFGMVPGLQATRPDVQEALKDGGRSSTPGARQHRMRGALAVAETALALVLLAGAGLMMKSLYRLFSVDSGFRADRVLTMEMDLRSTQYSKAGAALNFWQQVLERVSALPGVETTAVGTVVPFANNHSRADISIDGRAFSGNERNPHPDYHAISPGYLHALGIPLLHGRTFTDQDNETAPLVGLINSTLARRYWSNEDPIGKRFAFGGHPGPNTKWITIVGVVGDTKLYGLENPMKIEIYLPYRQQTHNDMTLLVRSAIDPAGLISSIKAAITTVDKDQPVFQVETMTELVNDSVSTRHATLVLLELFSALALVLATIGIYGVIAYSVALRTHEIGIRVAIGAQRSDVLRMVLGQGARLSLLGVAIGLAAAFALTRLLSSLLFEVNANDPVTFAAVAGILVLVAMVACAIPAIRATRVDPLIALRYE